MKNIKDIVIGIFAVIGFATIASGFSSNQAQAASHTVPESHVWEMYRGTESSYAYIINKQTGEVRKYMHSKGDYTIPPLKE